MRSLRRAGHLSNVFRLGRVFATEPLVVQFAKENRTWGYDRIVGALKNVGYTVSDQTVGNILKRHDIPPAPKRKKTTTWREFIRSHQNLLVATDFFTRMVKKLIQPCGI